MVSIRNEHLFLRLERENSREQYMAGIEILLTLLNNVIAEPQNNKYRTIRLENKIIKAKLLSLAGIRPCLDEIGFEEIGGELRLPANILIAQFKKYCDFLRTRLEAIKSGCGAAPPTGASCVVDIGSSKSTPETGVCSVQAAPARPSSVPRPAPPQPQRRNERLIPKNIVPYHVRIGFIKVLVSLRGM